MILYLKMLFYLSSISFSASIDVDSGYVDLRLTEQYNNHQVIKMDKADLRVYYDVWCGGCRYFHVHHLVPTYKIIGSHINLKTYPYGLSFRWEHDGKVEISCAEGQEECYGNKLHACAIDILKNISKSEFYNSCMMNGTWGGKGSTDKDAINCGKLMNIDSKPIMECANSERGEALLEFYGLETDKVTNPRDKYMPLILLNGKEFTKDDLLETICHTLTKPPPQCDKYF